MAHAVLLWLLISPLALAMVWLLLAGRGLQRVKYIGAAGLTAFSGLLALLADTLTLPSEPLCLFSHPSAGEMCVLLEYSSVKLCGLLSLMMAVLIATRMQILTITPVQASFLFASLSAGCLALVSQHFLLRYIALELAAIWLLIELFLAFQGEETQIRRSISAFINLRVGDVGLLIAIFLMLSASGSFIITRSLEEAQTLGSHHLALTISGLLLAAWVKMGVWPLNWWTRIGSHMHPSLFTWFCRLLIPTLGGYLLFRSAALISAIPALGNLLIMLASLCALVSALIGIFKSTYQETILSNQSFSSCLLLCLAAVGAINQILPALVTFLAARLLIDLLHRNESFFDAQQRSRQAVWLLWMRMLELLLFVPLVYIISENSSMGVWTLVLWIGFGLQFLPILGKMDVHFLALGSGLRPTRAVLRTTILTIAAGLGAYSLHHSVRLWLHSDHTLWKTPIFNQTFHRMPVMFAGLFCAGIILAAVKFTQKSPALKTLAQQTAGAIEELVAKQARITGSGDFLDQTPALARTYHHFIRYLYEGRDIFDQYPRLIRGFEKLTHFLYERVEQFTSVEIWRNLQNALFNMAHRLQGLHTGKLRLNLIWVVLVLVILVLLYLSGRLDVINNYG